MEFVFGEYEASEINFTSETLQRRVEFLLRNSQLCRYSRNYVLRKLKFHYRVYKSFSLLPILSQINPVHITSILPFYDPSEYYPLE
jgi:hypothetical protein